MTSSRRKNNQRWVNSPWLHTASDIARRWNRPVPITSWTDCSDSMVPITTLCVIPIQRYRHLYLRRFQFHKGAIRTKEEPAAPVKQPDFNSIKVRLEHPESCHRIDGRIFQFHKGTIRTLMWSIPYINIPLFQFHKGTIRTGFSFPGSQVGANISIP